MIKFLSYENSVTSYKSDFAVAAGKLCFLLFSYVSSMLIMGSITIAKEKNVKLTNLR